MGIKQASLCQGQNYGTAARTSDRAYLVTPNTDGVGGFKKFQLLQLSISQQLYTNKINVITNSLPPSLSPYSPKFLTFMLSSFWVGNMLSVVLV